MGVAAKARTLIVAACALTAASALAADDDAKESDEKEAARARLEKLMMQREAYDPAKGFAAMVDEASIRTVSAATRVEVVRLKGMSHPDPALEGFATATAKRGEPNVQGFAIDRDRLITDSGFIARLKQVVLSPTSYRHYEGMKLCGGFQPKVVFRFTSYGETVDVLLCFNCEDVAVRRSGSEVSFWSPLASMKSDAWWALAKEALPDDAFIQRQKRRH